MYANVTFLSLIIGMSSASETLVSQNFGSKNYKECGIILQRSICISACTAIPLTTLWLFSESIFLSIGVDLKVCQVIYQYLMIRIYAIPFNIITICYDKYVSAIGVVTPGVYGAIAQNIMLMVCNTLFIYKLKYSYHALAVSWIVSEVTGAAIAIFIGV